MGQYKPLGAFRLLLSAMVVFQHFGTNFAPTSIKGIAFPLETGTIAVAVFFLVSGFVIIEAVERFYFQRPIAFLANRSVRIFPMFVIALAIAICIELVLRHTAPGFAIAQNASQPQKFFATEILLNVAMVFDSLNLFKVYADHPFIESAWTLRQEYFFYIVVFIAMILSAKRDRSTYRKVIGAACIVFCATFIADYEFSLSNHSLEYAPFFIFGGAWYYISERQASKTVIVILLASAAGLVWQQCARLMIPASYERDSASQMVMLISLITVFCILSKASLDKTSAAKAVDAKLGDLTFSLYLNHQIVLTTFAVLFKPSIGSFLIGISASFAFSLIIHAIFEPSIALLRDKIRGGSLKEAAAKTEISDATSHANMRIQLDHTKAQQ